MRKRISFGNFAISSNQKANEIVLEVEYKKNDAGKPCFSVCGFSYRADHSDCIHGGQCLDELKHYLHGNKLFMEIYGLWKRNHLNDLDACANDEQRNAVNDYMAQNGNRYDYDGVCKYLQEKGIYTVQVNGEPCTYGYQWYYRPISKEDQKKIEEILKEAA